MWGRGTLRHARYLRSEAVARYVEVVKVLLHEGANPLVLDNIGRTCLHIAALHSASSCINAVLSSDYLGRPLREWRVDGTLFVDIQASRVSSASQLCLFSFVLMWMLHWRD
jgi:Ankyrin repeats (many copies)